MLRGIANPTLGGQPGTFTTLTVTSLSSFGDTSQWGGGAMVLTWGGGMGNLYSGAGRELQFGANGSAGPFLTITTAGLLKFGTASASTATCNRTIPFQDAAGNTLYLMASTTA